MSVKCDMCGSISNEYAITMKGDALCSKECKAAYRLERYLLNLEERRERDEKYNRRTYQQGRELSAILSVYQHGNKEAKKEAGKLIVRWWKS